MHRLSVAALLFVLIASPADAQKVYKWTNAQGQVQFTQTPPPDGVQSEQPKLADNEVTEQRRRYCGAIRSIAYRLALNSHQSISTVSEEVRQLEAREDLDVDQVALRELVNFVYAGAPIGRAAAYGGVRGDAADIAGRAENACLSGSFGKRGRTTVATANGKEEAPAQKQVGAGSFTGTGWITHGLIATNYHVIDGKDRIRVRFANGREATAFIGATDPGNDVALLRVAGQLPPGLPLAASEAAIGADVFTLGYPHTQIMGNNAKLSTGIVNSTTGLRDDPRLYQISVPVQSGNSGGPLLNRNGEVVGLVTAKLSAAQVYQWTGDLPQNVNYAVKVRFLQALLARGSGAYEDMSASSDSLENHAARIGPSVVLVIAE
jgi:S1-C subfamily serine protease